MKKTVFLLLVLLFAGMLKAQNVERYKKYHDKGRMLILEGKYEKAIHYLDSAIMIMPYYTTIFQDRGYAFMQLKKYDEAIADFDHVLSRKPYMNEARLQRGMAFFHTNQLDLAEYDLRQVAETNPRKSHEIVMYLNYIEEEKAIEEQELMEYHLAVQQQAEMERIRRARHREEVIWNTVIPLAFWTSVFLTW